MSKDPLRRIKYAAFCTAFMSPYSKNSYDDFVENCKFFLCKKNNVLLKDPIWDTYHDEEIIKEYYAHVLSSVPEELEKFKKEMNLTESPVSEDEDDDFFAWSEQGMKETKAKLETELDESEDSVSFSPSELGNED